MKYDEEKLKIKTEELLNDFRNIWVNTDEFKVKASEYAKEIEDWSSDSESIASIISILSENIDGIGESEEFIRFWKLFKMKHDKVKGFRKMAIDSFEGLMKEEIEDLQKAIDPSEEKRYDRGMQRVIMQLRGMTRGLEFHGLRPQDSVIMYTITGLTIYSNMFTETIEEIIKRLNWNEEQSEELIELEQ